MSSYETPGWAATDPLLMGSDAFEPSSVANMRLAEQQRRTLADVTTARNMLGAAGLAPPRSLGSPLGSVRSALGSVSGPAAPKNKGVTRVYTGFNIAKAVVGAGSFALPWACKNLGLAGGMISMVISALLAVYTIEMLIRVKDQVEWMTRKPAKLSYVDVTRETLGAYGAYFVFGAQFCASMGACSAYLSFIGSTLFGLCQAKDTWMNEHMGGWTKQHFEQAAMFIIVPVTWLRSFRFLRFTSTIGTAAVFLALVATLYDGLHDFPTWEDLWIKILATPMWPNGFKECAQSIGCIMFLFCANFLMIPIGRSMAAPETFASTLELTFVPITVVNMLFGGLCFVYFGDKTSEIVTNNLGSWPFLIWVKILLCIDLLLTYPLVFTSAREIVERVWMDEGDVVHDALTLGAMVHDGAHIEYEIDPKGFETPGAQTPAQTPNPSFRSFSEMGAGEDGLQNDASSTASGHVGARPGYPGVIKKKKKKPLFTTRKNILIRSTLVFFSYLFAQAKSFGIITNVVGGFAEGSLAFVIPPAMDLQLNYERMRPLTSVIHVLLIIFGVVLGAVTSYEAIF